MVRTTQFCFTEGVGALTEAAVVVGKNYVGRLVEGLGAAQTKGPLQTSSDWIPSPVVECSNYTKRKKTYLMSTIHIANISAVLLKPTEYYTCTYTYIKSLQYTLYYTVSF